MGETSKVRHFWNCFVIRPFRVQLLQGIVNQEANERMGSHTYATRHWIASCYSSCYMFWQLKSYFGFRFRYRKGTTFSSSRKKTPFIIIIIIYLLCTPTPIHKIPEIHNSQNTHYWKRHSVTSIKKRATLPQGRACVACKDTSACERHLPKCPKMATSSQKNR